MRNAPPLHALEAKSTILHLMASTFTVATWNVNSIRARLDPVLTFLAEIEPDIACLQETKVDDQVFPRVPFLELGYQVTTHGSKGLAGVATLTKERPTSVQRGFICEPPDLHARILNVQVRGIRIYNVYVPNGTELGSTSFAYKLDWLARLRAELDASCVPNEPLAIVGDFNVAPQARDVWDPMRFEGHILCTPEERRALLHLAEFGLTDCFRRHESEPGHYTWFDYRTNGFMRNEGLRIDHVYATESLAARCTKVVHHSEPRGWDKPSDHLPVVATFVE